MALILGLLWCVPPTTFAADEPAKDKAKVTFEEHVLPIFKARCVKCHAGAEPAQGLRLTTRREILRGGKSGPAMRIAAAESSLLWEKLASNEMPKGGPALSADEKGVLRSWTNDGAASTEATEEAANELKENAGQQPNDHWAFRPPVRPPVPNARHADRVRTPIDWQMKVLIQSAGRR